MKNTILFILLCVTFWCQAQVGINTTNPEAQLDIKSSNQALPSNKDGLLIPKIDAFPVTNPTVAQQGMLVYLTTTVGTNLPGFYYWNNSPAGWLSIKGNNGGTLDQAYDFGGAGLGKTITADAGAVTINGTDGLVVTGTSGSGALAPTGAGVRMVWNPRRVSFRAGIVTGTAWDDVNVGQSSIAFGQNTIASGIASTAFGAATTASGDNSTSFGIGTNANGFASTAFGNTTTATGSISTAFGSNTTASGDFSTAFGRNNTASSYGETSIGIGATTYTPTTNGDTQYRTANGTDRLFVIGNAIDANSNGVVDVAERSDALVILKNGATGIGTALPEGILDAKSTKNGILIPRVSLTSAIVQAPVLNPQTGNIATSTLIYNIATAGVAPNNVYPGFYYWNSSKWTRFDVDGENNPKYYTITGTTNDFSTTSFSLLEQMSITYTPKDNVALINFSAAGHRGDDNCQNNVIFFQILLNGIPVTGWQISTNQSIVDIPFATDDITTWDTNISYPITVPIGTSQTIQIQWYAPNCTMSNTPSSPLTAFGAVFKSYRALTVIDPNGGGGIVGAPPVTTNLWAHNGNAGTNAATNFVGTADNQPLVLKSNSIEGLRIGTTGNVGIGTTLPLSKLHVAGNIRMVDGNQAAGKILVSDANGTATWQNATSTAWGITGNSGISNPTTPAVYGTTPIGATENWNGTTDANDYVLGTNGIERFRIKQGNGFVGIGTSAPSRVLHVFKGSSGALPNINANFVLEGNGSFYQHFLTSPTGEAGLLFGSSAGSIQGGVSFNNANESLQFRTGGNTNRMIINNVGDVGIGTATPLTRLEIVDQNKVTTGTVRGNLNVMSNDPQAIDVGGAITLGGYRDAAASVFRVFGSIEGRKSNNTVNTSDGYLMFKTNNAGVLTERLRIINSGDIGVGTPTPGGQFELSLNEGRKPTSNTWIIPSDARLKNVNGVYAKGLQDIIQLKPIRYNYKNTEKRTFDPKVLANEAYGFLAQEVQGIFPEAVGVDTDGYLNFDLHPILIAYVNALKELNEKNETLQLENETLKNELEALKQKVDAILVEVEKLKK